jgi:quercetin dioxygenase-like cupin family protein
VRGREDRARRGGETYTLAAGDVVAFRGDQRHSYANPGKSKAVGYSVVVIAPGVVAAAPQRVPDLSSA